MDAIIDGILNMIKCKDKQIVDLIEIVISGKKSVNIRYTGNFNDFSELIKTFCVS